MQVDYSKETRRINLARGEAMFKVTKDPSRPFIVNAGGAIARAVGTRFGVEHREDRIRVTVAEGKVTVVRGDQAAALEQALDLQRGDSARRRRGRGRTAQCAGDHAAQGEGELGAGARVGERPADPPEWDARRSHRRVQSAQPLQIRVDDPAIAGWHVCCVFDAANPKAFRKADQSPSDGSGEDVVWCAKATRSGLVRAGPRASERLHRTTDLTQPRGATRFIARPAAHNCWICSLHPCGIRNTGCGEHEETDASCCRMSQ